MTSSSTAPQVALTISRDNASAVIAAYSAQPEPSAEALDHATYILSEWLNDAAPLGERRYREPARALLKFASLIAALSAPTEPVPLKTADEATAWVHRNKATGAKSLSWHPVADLPFNREHWEWWPLYPAPKHGDAG